MQNLNHQNKDRQTPRADFLALQGEYLSVTQETKSEKKSATDIVNELRSKAAKTSQTAPQQEAPEEPEQAEAMQDKETQYQTEEKGNLLQLCLFGCGT